MKIINFMNALNTGFVCVITLMLMILAGCSAKEESFIREGEKIDFDIKTLNQIPNNPDSTLSVPTYITKVDDTYFIVDCYHNRVIYNDNLEDPLYEWFVMTEDMKLGHTLASDGDVYLIDDTENNRILVMKKGLNENGMKIFYPVSEFNNIGTRPHYIIYDDKTETFYAWSSMTGEMYLFKNDKEKESVYLSKVCSIPELNGYYVRSFTIMDDRILFVSGNAHVIEANLSDFKVLNRYPVSMELVGMSQITKIQDYYYITVSTDGAGSQDAATIIRTKKLENLANGEYEDIYSYFEGGGTPYCITAIGDDYYLCEHRLPSHGIWKFNVENNEIKNVITLYY